MKIAIISDTHDNLATLDKFLAYVRKNPAAAVIHCGDIASGQTLEHLAKGFDGPPAPGARLARTGGKIFVVLGNMDYVDSVERAAARQAEKVTLFKNFGRAEFDGLKIGFCHHRERALAASESEKFDFLFYGHSHKPWTETAGGGTLANPGTLAGLIYQATFAVLDTRTRKLELKIVSRLAGQ